jgi:hypothetical protein
LKKFLLFDIRKFFYYVFDMYSRTYPVCLTLIATVALSSANATTWTVTSTSDSESDTMSLPYAMLQAVAGDTIDCFNIAGLTITLTKSLPALSQSTLTIQNSGSPVTINGSGTYSAFQVAAGAISISNFTLASCASKGGVGGVGTYGGGGGAGGGAGLYIHDGSNVTVSGVTFTGNTATGGAGGNAGTGGCGGGGGGFGGGVGGASAATTGGGGGGGFSNGGAGGAGAVAGSTGIFLGGGGGGGGSAAGGGAKNQGTLNPANQFSGGTSGATLGGGGGAGDAAAGASAATINGENGGSGIGADTNFGGGGGGGAGAATGQGGSGTAGGGGGGAMTTGTGGNGGFGGGGGGGQTPGTGGFGGGGSGGTTAGSTGFGGGIGGTGTTAGGGGGAAMGGAIFVGNKAVLQVEKNGLISGNTATGGAAGTGGNAFAGTAYGPDLFIQSGGTVNFNLTTGNLTISTPIQSDIGAGGGTGGGLSLQGTMTLTLTGSNTYTGGTTITSGTLAISSDQALGNSSFGLTIANGTLQATQAFSSARSISLTGAATLDTRGDAITLSGNITGPGSFSIIDSTNTGSTVNLSGTNNYSGGTSIGAKMTLLGTTSSLQGNIALQASTSTVTFNQTSNGTYSGVLSGAGILNIAGTSGTMQITGNSTGFTGPVNVSSGKTLQIDGSLANASLVTVPSGATLIGTGTVGTTQNSGTISPGDSGGAGTLSFNGTLTLMASSQLQIAVPSAGSSGLIQVSGTAALNGSVLFNTAATGFYGFSKSYLFLSSAGLGGTTFSSYSFTNPNFMGTVTYSSTNAYLTLTNATPFLGFPFYTANERHVGNYLDDLNATGVISPFVVDVVNSMDGFTVAEINNALDQMHPAIYSALVGGLQPSVGGQILSLFHRRPYLTCGCREDRRIWVVPMGNWLKEGNLGEQTAYQAQTRGLVAGYDKALGENWVLGGGAAWNEASLLWQRNRGTGTVHKYLGAIYSDFFMECYSNQSFYCGFSFYGGLDDNNIERHIEISTYNLHASGHFYSLDLGGQFSTAYLFGTPNCLLYPYANGDFFYFRGRKISEKGASALDLDINPYITTTVRCESGLGLQVQDTNWDETICVAPMFELGWAMELPIDRPAFHCRFAGMPFGFEAKGWDHTFQMFTIDAGLKITIHGFVINGEYRSEMALDGRDNFWDQRGNLSLEYTW